MVLENSKQIGSGSLLAHISENSREQGYLQVWLDAGVRTLSLGPRLFSRLVSQLYSGHTPFSDRISPMVSRQLCNQYLEQSQLRGLNKQNHFVFSPIISFQCALMNLLSLSLMTPQRDLKSFWSLLGIKKSKPLWSSLKLQSQIQVNTFPSP